MKNQDVSALKLHAHVSGKGKPVVFLHGLFGSWQNLGTAIRSVAEHYQVHALDLRNHGKSPHSAKHDYPSLAGDVAQYIDSEIAQESIVVGHSMGGKTAMMLALTRPDILHKLIIVDIAPRSYKPNHDEILRGMAAMQGKTFNSRGDVDNALANWVPEVAIRSFLLKNLILKDGIASWRLNLNTLAEQYPHIADWPQSQLSFDGPVLFLKGAESDYLVDDDREVVQRLFPKAQLKSIAATGHWPHAEKPAVFNKLLLDFINKA